LVLITSSNFVGFSIGKSAGFAPLRIKSYRAGKSGGLMCDERWAGGPAYTVTIKRTPLCRISLQGRELM
jgi:hypothetical protein